MRTVLFLFLLVCAMSCTKRVYLPSETKIVEREVVKLVPYPVHVDREVQSVVTISDSSYLENRWCSSLAVVDSAGLLHHNLIQKDTTVIIEVVEKEIVSVRDSTIYVPVEGDTITKEVTPSWCWWLIVAIAIALIPYIMKFVKLFKV